MNRKTLDFAGLGLSVALLVGLNAAAGQAEPRGSMSGGTHGGCESMRSASGSSMSGSSMSGSSTSGSMGGSMGHGGSPMGGSSMGGNMSHGTGSSMGGSMSRGTGSSMGGSSMSGSTGQSASNCVMRSPSTNPSPSASPKRR